jgi:hypothetical protein
MRESLKTFKESILLDSKEIKDEVLDISWSSMSKEWMKGTVQRKNMTRKSDLFLEIWRGLD